MRLTLPFRWPSPASMAVMRNPLRTKNTWSGTHAPGRVWKSEWYTTTGIMHSARTPVRGGRLPSLKVWGLSGDASAAATAPSTRPCSAAAISVSPPVD